MRYYILDDLVDPVSGGVLRVENAVVADRPGSPVQRCKRWCGYRGCAVADLAPGDCCTCHDQWIVSGELVAEGTGTRYPIINGIPRLLYQPIDEDNTRAALSTQTQESFGYEWEHFNQTLPEYEVVAQSYFRPVPPGLLEGALVLDAGCGMGRWARYICRQPVRRLYAVDFSRAIDRAAITLADQDQAHCIQADLRQLPFRPHSFDFIYSLGVLHHLVDPNEGMRSLVTRLKDSGALLVYLYYALDNRPAFFRWLLGAVTLIRQVTSRLPKPAMHGLAWAIALGIYWPLARLARLLDQRGFASLARNVPLAAYAHHSLPLMVNDAFDRFATPIEKRYTRAQIRVWLARHGLEATFSDAEPYWVALGAKPR